MINSTNRMSKEEYMKSFCFVTFDEVYDYFICKMPADSNCEKYELPSKLLRLFFPLKTNGSELTPQTEELWKLLQKMMDKNSWKHYDFEKEFLNMHGMFWLIYYKRMPPSA